MAGPLLRWTPAGAAQISLELPYVTRFEGFRRGNVRRSVSDGGESVVRTLDTFAAYFVEIKSVGPSVDRTVFARLSAWWSHVSGGGEFAFAKDANQVASTTLSSGAADGDDELTVVSSSGIAVDDWLVLEDANDAGVYEWARVGVVDSATAITLRDALAQDYASGSVVRHAEYFPACLVLEDEPPFRERPAGQGPVWDLSFSFRTVAS